MQQMTSLRFHPSLPWLVLPHAALPKECHLSPLPSPRGSPPKKMTRTVLMRTRWRGAYLMSPSLR